MGQDYLVGLSELNLTSEGYLPRVETLEEVAPPNAIDIQIGQTDYWEKVKREPFIMLSIGTPITSELAFLTMFNEYGVIEGGRSARDEEYGSERHSRDCSPSMCWHFGYHTVQCQPQRPEQMHVTTAYILEGQKGIGTDRLLNSPERRIFDHLWRGKEMMDRDPESRGFSES